MIIQINLIMIINIFNKAKIAITYTLQNYNSNYQKQLLKQVISYRKVKNFLLKNFKLLPFLFNEQIIQKYFQCDKLPVYAKYISKMNQKMQSQKLNSLQKQMFMISPRFFQAKSLIQTYLDFLHTYFEEQVLRSNVLFQYSDIKNPQQWYFKTRKLTRKIIYNHGPTNSGKTSYALEQLKNAKIGIYMAPLRLLAWQTQQILLPCNLITGQQKLHMNSGLTSCTIQTTDFKKQYDVAVIDQIQMIADPERGWGWTQALLRIKAKVLHVCGNQRALELIEKLLKNTSDSLQQKKYSRLSKLKLINDKYVLQKDLQKGDCIIAFSAEKLFSIRKRINSIIKKKKNSVAIIYGKLPPQIRKIQAHLFNQGKLPYLVATNAIGMGLNLKIKRIIFFQLQKMDSNGELQTISNHEIQQIAGRAGRSSEDGYVQTLNLSDFKKVRKALRDVNKSYGINLEQNMDTLLEIQKRNEDIKEQSYEQYANESINLKRKFLKEQTELKSAGLSISFDQLQRFKYQIQALQNKKYSLDQIFNQFIQICQMDQTFFIQKVKTSSILLKQIQNFNLELKDQYTFSMVPINSTNNKILLNQYSNLARMYKYQKQVKLPEIIKKIHQHQIKYKQEFSRLKFLQYNYSILQMYIWLSGKYQLAFRHKEQAQKLKNYICAKINNILLIESDETKQKDFISQKRTKRD